MIRICLLLVSVAMVSAKPEGDDRKCMRLMHPPTAACCKTNTIRPMPEDEECFKNHGMPLCDRDICLANKKGFASLDGTVDKEALIKFIEEKFEGNANLIEQLKEKCVNGNIDKYGPPDFCDLSKLNHCISLETVMQCTDWEDEGHCKDVKQLVKDCEGVFQKL